MAAQAEDEPRDKVDMTGASNIFANAADAELTPDARRRLDELNAEYHALAAERDRHWTQVVETRAASVADGQLTGPLTYSDRRLQVLLSERTQRLAQIEHNRSQQASLKTARERELATAEAEADKQQRLFEQARTAFDNQLADDAHYQALARRAIDAQRAEQGLRERMTHAVDERNEKTDRYLADPLFAYLRRRNYGRKEYAGAGLRYRLDRWVATVAKFTRAQQDFELLNDMPRWLQEKVDATAQIVVESDASLTAYLETFRETEALRELQDTADHAARALTDVRTRIAKTIESERMMDEEWAAAQTHQDRYSREMRDLYRRSFSDQPIAALLKLAEQTESTVDQKALIQIDRIDRRLADIEQRIEQMLPPPQAMARGDHGKAED